MTPEELKGIEERINKTSWEFTVNGLFNKADCDFVMYGKQDLQQLLDYIKELESRLPRWIPVEERMPEEKAVVTACIKNRRVFPDVFYTEGCWYSDKGIVKGITHWQPLPKGPEE